MDEAMIRTLALGIWETLYMTLVSTAFAYLLGLPLGVCLFVTQPGRFLENKALNRVLGLIVNLMRSVPFLILMIFIQPFTRFLLGYTLGSTATIVPLVVAAVPFIGRMVEGALSEVDEGVVEAAQSMGARPLQIITKVLIPEALPSLLSGATIAVATILGYSAMAGAIGGGGLGVIAINYGYARYRTDIMTITVVLLVCIVQLLQYIGSFWVRKVDKRRR